MLIHLHEGTRQDQKLTNSVAPSLIHSTAENKSMQEDLPLMKNHVENNLPSSPLRELSSENYIGGISYL